MIGIYKIISPSGKIYIGQSLDINKRKQQYVNSNCKEQPKIYRSIKKYGWDKHIFEIIEECHVNQLDIRETFWKQYYINQNNGDWNKMLFCGLHDSGGGPKSEATRQKMSIIHTGKEKPWVSVLRKNIPQKQETIDKRVESMKHTKNIIYQYSYEGVFIREWRNARECSQTLNINNGWLSTVINSNCSLTINNYRFSKMFYQQIPKELMENKRKKPIIQIGYNNTIKEWESAAEAARVLNIHENYIHNCCKGKQKQTKGFKFKYA